MTKRCLKFSNEYSERLLAIDINIKIDEMLETGWELMAKYFSKAEVGVKDSLVEKYGKWAS